MGRHMNILLFWGLRREVGGKQRVSSTRWIDSYTYFTPQRGTLTQIIGAQYERGKLSHQPRNPRNPPLGRRREGLCLCGVQINLWPIKHKMRAPRRLDTKWRSAASPSA